METSKKNNSINNGFSISAISIRQHIGTLMLTLAVIIMGIFFLMGLPVDLLPSITYPRIGVRIEAPGVSPNVAVDEITKPLEESFSATEGVLQVFSQTREGQISLDLYFQPGGNIDQALNDATATFNRARGRLPDTIREPRIFKIDPSQLPVYEFAVSSQDLQGVDLRVFAEEELARELNVVPGVAVVDVSGGVQEEIRINLDLQRLQSLGITINDVLNELKRRNQDISGGRILGTTSEKLTRTIGRFQNTEEIKNLLFEVPIPNSNLKNRVYLRDFAEIIDGAEKQRVFVSLNGEPAVKVSIQKQPDANTVDVVERVKTRLSQLQKSGIVNDKVTFTPTLDESTFIRNSINNVTSSGLIGTVLAALAVLLFLGSLRQTLIIIISIPLASLTAIIFMGLFGLSLNVFSLGGLALGVGIVVDNSIVMLENISQGLKNSHLSIIEQSEKSSREVESALLASTSTNLVAVLPFLLIGGFISLLFNELILTISFAVAASILVAVTVVPMMTSRLLGLKLPISLTQFWLFKQFNDRFEAATRVYGNFLFSIVKWRFLTILIIVSILVSGSLWMTPQIPQEILPRINTGQATLFAQFPPGTPLETNQKVMAAVGKILRNQPETKYVFSTVGGSLFASSTTANPLRSSSTITLKPGTNVETYIQKVSKQLNQLNLVDIRLRLTPGQVRGLILNNSPVRGADIDVILQGNDSKILEQTGRQVLRTLDEKVKSVRFRPDADSRQPEILILPDWERVANVGLNTQEIGETIQTAITGTIPTQVQRDNRLVDVRVKLNENSIESISQLERLPLFVNNKSPIKLSDVAKISQGKAPGEIQRINQRQVFLIAGNLNKGASLGTGIAEVTQVLGNIELPPGVSILPSAALESNQQIQKSLGLLGGLAIFLVFVVMAVQYNSLVDPLVIMFTIPLALAGGIFGLYITNTSIGATVIVGAVLLVGIVVNNAIIMVELANQIREQEKIDHKTAILKAAPQRLRPILMTTITTVLGMFPLALGIGEGAEFLQPLGVVVFSGLSLATLLTLFIIPCFYTLLHDIFSPRWTKLALIKLRLWKKRGAKIS